MSLGPQLGCGHCLGDIVKHRDRLVSGRLLPFLLLPLLIGECAKYAPAPCGQRTMERTVASHHSHALIEVPALIASHDCHVRIRNEDSGRREALVVRYECARTVTV